MKLIRSQAESIVQVLKDVLINNRYADKSIEGLFKESSVISPDDRTFIAESSYDIIRYYRMLEEVSKNKSLWKLLGTWAVLRGFELNNWKEFASTIPDTILQHHDSILPDRKIRDSI